MAQQQAIKAGKILSTQEMHHLLSELLNCKTPNVTMSGQPTYIEFKADYLQKLFIK